MKWVSPILEERTKRARKLDGRTAYGPYGAFSSITYEGAWHGNDTLWRTILDLNRIATYAGRDGVLEPSPQRRVFCLVDAVVSGEGEGPMRPADRSLGAVLAGANSLAVDMVAAKLMGFDFSAIPQLPGGLRLTSPPLFNGSRETIMVAGEESEPLDSWFPEVAPHRPAPTWSVLSRNDEIGTPPQG